MTAAGRKPGRFTVLGRTRWSRLCALEGPRKLDALISYLILLTGTDETHRETRWSVQAINRYTGMNKARIRACLNDLERAELIVPDSTASKQSPRYMLTSYPEDGEPIFLPAELVRGLSRRETPVLVRVRQTGDWLLLRLLIDLYGAVTTDLPYAVGPAWLRRVSSTLGSPIMPCGVHQVWSFPEPDSWEGEIDLASYVERTRSRGAARLRKDFQDQLQRLVQIGAVYQELWLCTSADADADPMFPLTPEVEHAGDDSARTLLRSRWTTGDEGFENDRLLVLPTHLTSAAVVGLVKLRVEPDTPARRRAFIEREQAAAHWRGEYVRLQDESAAEKFDRPLVTLPRG